MSVVVLQRYYFYFENLVWTLLEICPPFVRTLAFRAALKRFGSGSLVDYGCYIRYPWKVSIGRASTINRGCKIYPSLAIKEAEIVIGDHVAVGPGVALCSAGHDHSTLDLADVGATIRVGNSSWIGAGALIIPGVEIGEGAVVGAGSIVTRNVAPWTIVAGNPAKPIGKRSIQ